MSNYNRTKLNHFIQAVKDVNIQGATDVASSTAEALIQLIFSSPAPVTRSDWQQLENAAHELSRLRPTEPMARNLARWIISELRAHSGKSVRNQDNWYGLSDKLTQEYKYLLKETEANLSAVGSKLVRSGQTIFTHCHSSLAEGVLVRARSQKKKFKVYHTETRPLFQGRITSRHLKIAGIPAVMVADGVAAWLVSDHSGDDVKIDWVLLGADSISPDGSVINKIGSFAIALSAHDSGIPVYIASTLLKIDAHNESRIELRSEKELWPQAPSGTKIVNYAFDRIPSKYITGIISEFGVVKPKQALLVAQRNYPWIFNGR